MNVTIQNRETSYQGRFFLEELEATGCSFVKRRSLKARGNSIWGLPDETAQTIVHLVQPGDDQIDNLILDFNYHFRR